MSWRMIGVLCWIVLGLSCLRAQEKVATTVKDVYPDRILIVVLEGSKERPIYVTPGIKFLKSNGDNLVDAVSWSGDKEKDREALRKALEKLKESVKVGTEVTVVFDRSEKKTVIRELRFSNR